jgi:hypothetical protein
MPVSWSPNEFPRLTFQNHQDTSPATNRYNCVAWAAGNDTRWWWPDSANIYFWPPNVPRDETIDAFLRAYGTVGYTQCGDGDFEIGQEKIAIFGVVISGTIYPTHAALQLIDGKWTSKLGSLEDIIHDNLDSIGGGRYGQPICFLSRPRQIGQAD